MNCKTPTKETHVCSICATSHGQIQKVSMTKCVEDMLSSVLVKLIGLPEFIKQLYICRNCVEKVRTIYGKVQNIRKTFLDNCTRRDVCTKRCVMTPTKKSPPEKSLRRNQEAGEKTREKKSFCRPLLPKISPLVAEGWNCHQILIYLFI